MMERVVALLALCCALSGALAADVTVAVESGTVLAELHPRFVSFTQDASTVSRGWAGFNFSSKASRACLKAMRPAYLRFGGTEGDNLQYVMGDATAEAGPAYPQPANTMNSTDLKLLFDYFAVDAGLDMIFGLNDLTSRACANCTWQTGNASVLVKALRENNFTVAGFELGNEPDLFDRHGASISPEQLSKDFKTLQAFLEDAYDEKARPFILGPDVAYNNDLLHNFTKAQEGERGGPAVRALTVHHYYGDSKKFNLTQFLDPGVLDSLIDKIAAFQEAVASADSQLPIWLGETSSTYGGGTANLSESYAAGFMWLDKLGTAARMNITLVARQSWALGRYSLVNDAFQPVPDWYTSYMWKQVMGERVLAVKGVADKGRKVRSYAFCAKAGAAPRGAVVVMVLNVQPETASVAFEGVGPSSGRREDYVFGPACCVPNSAGITLNGGAPLSVGDDGTLPVYRPSAAKAGDTLKLAPYAIAFSVFPDAGGASC